MTVLKQHFKKSLIQLCIFVFISASMSLPLKATESVGLDSNNESTEYITNHGVLEKTFRDIAVKNDLPSLAGVSVESEKRGLLVAVGQRSMQTKSVIEITDKWHIGSITKPMTATLAAILVKNNRVEWDTTVSEVWPDMKIHSDYASVTLTELLSHKSGITKDITRTTNWTARFGDNRDMQLQRAEWAEEILTQKPEYQRGDFAYSNAGYVVAGAMLETLMGKPWEQLIQENLFQPIGMTHSGFGAPTGESPWGHKTNFFMTTAIDPGASGKFADNPAAMGPAGTVHVTLQDMAQFIKLHLGQFPQVLDLKELNDLHASTGAEGDYHNGWIHVERQWAKGKALTHSGSNTFWYATLWIAPKAGRGYFTVTNIAHRKAAKALDDATVALMNTND